MDIASLEMNHLRDHAEAMNNAETMWSNGATISAEELLFFVHPP